MNANTVLRRVLLTLIATLSSLTVLLLTILGTESGSRLLIQTLLPKAGIDVSVESIDGALLREMTLRGIDYRSATEHITLDTFNFGWQAWALLSGALQIDSLSMNGLSIETIAETHEPDDEIPFSLPKIPLTISIANIDFQSIRYKSDGQDIAIERIRLSTVLHDGKLRLTDLTVKMPEASINGLAEIELQENLPISARLNWTLMLPENPALTGNITILGSLDELWLSGAAEGFLSMTHHARLNLTESVPTFNVSGRWQKLQWPLSGDPDIASEHGEFNVAGTLEDYRIDLNAQLRLDQQPMALLLSGKGKSDSLTLEQLKLTPNRGELILQGRIAWAEDPISVALTGDWEKLQWPLMGPAQAASEQGRFDLSGTLDAYRIKLTSKLSLEQLPPFDVDFLGQGGTDSLIVERLTLRPKQGRLDLHGNVSWVDAIDFALNFDAHKINPGDFTPDVTGSLNLKASATGHFVDERVNVNLDIEKLDGTIFESVINGRGKLIYADDRLAIDKLLLQSADNRVTADGVLSAENSNLDFSIDAPNLASAWPELTGAIKGNGNVRGNYLDPDIKADLQASKLRYRNYRLELLSLNLNYAEALASRSYLDLSAQGLDLDGQRIEQLTLKGTGSPKNHQFQLNLAADALRLDTALTGSFGNEIWHATLHRLDIEHEQLQRWQLDKPWPIRLDFTGNAIAADLPQNCLTQAASALCLSADGSLDHRFKINAEARNIELDRLKPWLPEDMIVSGDMNANANLLIQGERWTVDADALIPAASVLLTRPNDTALTLPLTETRLSVRYRDDRLDTDLRIGLTGQDFIGAQLQAEPLTSTKAHSLSGTVQASIADLSLIDTLVPDIENLQGRITADLTLSGTTDQPEVSGLLQISNAELDVPETGIHLNNIALRLLGQPGQSKQIALTGSIDSGKGTLYLDGNVELNSNTGFPAELLVTGSEFEIARMPEAEISVSPRLTIEQSQASLKVNGEINVDNADLKLIELPENAIAPSPDEIIIGAETAEDVGAVLNLHTDLQILLGDRTHFSGYGLNSRLTGNLRYTASPGKQRMQGRVAMKDAKYKAYGQNLTISKGELLFNGPPDNPWLNFEATRKAIGENVTAVLTVTGPLQSPESKVSSRPALPESEALAYLLTGRSLQRAGESQSDMLAKAAINYGAGELSWLSNQLGFDQFEVEEAERLEDTALRLGKYINPDLYLGLSLGLFSNTYAVILKQQLSNSFSLETRAGESQRIDLKYRLDKD